MKKIISLMIVAVLFVSCMVPAAFATETKSASLSAGSATVNPGDEVTVGIFLSGSGLGGGELFVNGSEFLTFVSASVGNLPGANVVDNYLQFGVTEDQTGSFTWANVTFKVSENAVPGSTYSFSLTEIDVYSNDWTGLASGSATVGSIKIAGEAPTEPTVTEPEPTVTEPEPTVTEPEPTVTEPEPTVTDPVETDPPTTEKPDDGNKDDVPKTGDITPQIMFFTAAVVTMAVAAFFAMKRKATK